MILVPEPPTPILPPVGVKARVMSPTTIVVMWTDTGLGRRQRNNENRIYTVRYRVIQTIVYRQLHFLTAGQRMCGLFEGILCVTKSLNNNNNNNNLPYTVRNP